VVGWRGNTQHNILSGCDWCNANLEPGARILLHDVGCMSFATSFPLIDIVGLKSPAAVEKHRQLTYPSAGSGRQAAIDAIASETSPDYAVILDGWDDIYAIKAG